MEMPALLGEFAMSMWENRLRRPRREMSDTAFTAATVFSGVTSVVLLALALFSVAGR
jgi:hypothetical protein